MTRFIKVGNVIYNVETIYKIIFDDVTRSITVVYTDAFDDYQYRSDKKEYDTELYAMYKKTLHLKINGVEL